MAKSPKANSAEDQPLRRRGNRLYLAIWALLGLGAASYLALLATGEDVFYAQNSDKLADETTVSVSETYTTGSSDDARWTQLSRDIGSIKQTMSTLSSDIAQVRTVQNETDLRISDLEGRRFVGGAQAAQRPVTQQISKATGDVDDSAIQGTTLDGVTTTVDAGGVASPPTSATGDDQAALAALLGTPEAATRPEVTPVAVKPEVDTAPAAEPERKIAAIVPIPGRRTYGVELAAGDSVDSLRLSWALLNERHRDLLGRLAPRYIRSSATGTPDPYRLIAGPFKSSRGAQGLCEKLQAYYVNCRTSAFTGDVL